MVKAIYPGSFDPVTLGQLDIIQRAAKAVNQLVIGVAAAPPEAPLFTLEERVGLLKEVTKDYPNVTVKAFRGITVEFARENGARFIISDLRAVTDFESGMQAAQTNRSIDPELDTMFFTTSLNYMFLSSAIVREMATFGADISKLVPSAVKEALERKAGHGVRRKLSS